MIVAGGAPVADVCGGNVFKALKKVKEVLPRIDHES